MIQCVCLCVLSLQCVCLCLCTEKPVGILLLHTVICVNGVNDAMCYQSECAFFFCCSNCSPLSAILQWSECDDSFVATIVLQAVAHNMWHGQG